jgi:hypothetical protein
MRNNVATESIIELASRRILDRYQFGAEHIAVKTLFKVGFTLEIGDIVVFGSPALKLPDIKVGDTDFQPRLMEVTNKKTNLSTGETEVELTDTSFDIDSRYCTISPSSNLDSGSTTASLKIKTSYYNLYRDSGSEAETNKWSTYVGHDLRVHSADFTYNETCTLLSIDRSSPNTLTVSALTSPPLVDYIIDLAPYAGGIKENQIVKQLHGYFTPQVAVASGVSSTSFTVGAGDISKFFVGGYVRVHTYDYTSDSGDTKIVDITSNTITVRDDLGFTPNNTMYIDLIGFNEDDGLPYRYI